MNRYDELFHDGERVYRGISASIKCVGTIRDGNREGEIIVHIDARFLQLQHWSKWPELIEQEKKPFIYSVQTESPNAEIEWKDPVLVFKHDWSSEVTSGNV